MEPHEPRSDLRVGGGRSITPSNGERAFYNMGTDRVRLKDAGEKADEKV